MPNSPKPPKPEDSIIYRQRRKGQDVAHSDIGPGGVPKPIDPAKLEQRREHQRRLRETAKFNQETGRICTKCGKIVSGPHTGESGGAYGAKHHEYKGHKYSSVICDDCQADNERDWRAQYMEYRRQKGEKEQQ